MSEKPNIEQKQSEWTEDGFYIWNKPKEVSEDGKETIEVDFSALQEESEQYFTLEPDSV